jgi:Uncharacterized protein conserved in bacteria
MRSLHILCAAALLVPATAASAQQPSPPSATGVVDSFRGLSALFGSRLVVAFDSIPASRYGYAPTPAQQTVGFIAQHLVNANYALCERFDGRPRPVRASDALPDTVRAKWPKDTLLARLRESFAFCAAASANVDDSMLGREIAADRPGSGPPQQRARSMLLFVTDLAEHYAQLSSYMRTMGLVPPSGLPAVHRTAVDVPAAVLSRYAGRYEVPASRQFGAPAVTLDISQRDGALFVIPVGQPEAQLWPMSESDFYLKVSPATLTFTRDASGAVTGLVLHNSGEDRPGRKVR